MHETHVEIFVQVLIEFFLNFVQNGLLFYLLSTVFVLGWKKTSNALESNELWVYEIFFHRNQKLRNSLVMEGFVS
jgi:hypothetical protein